MKNLTLKISSLFFVILITNSCTKSTNINENTKNNSNHSTQTNITIPTNINQDQPIEKKEFNLPGTWKQVSSKIGVKGKPIFVRDYDIFFIFDEKGNGVYKKYLKGTSPDSGETNKFKWKLKDEKTLILDKIQDEVLEFELDEKAPRHMVWKSKVINDMYVLLQKSNE